MGPPTARGVQLLTGGRGRGWGRGRRWGLVVDGLCLLDHSVPLLIGSGLCLGIADGVRLLLLGVGCRSRRLCRRCGEEPRAVGGGTLAGRGGIAIVSTGVRGRYMVALSLVLSSATPPAVPSAIAGLSSASSSVVRVVLSISPVAVLVPPRVPRIRATVIISITGTIPRSCYKQEGKNSN